MQFLLLTGATGLLGEYLMRDFLQAGIKLAVIARSNREGSARTRIESILHRWETRLGYSLTRPVVLEGEITQPGLGLSAKERNWVTKHCSSLMHNAASLTFDSDRADGEPWLSNLVGTQNAVDLAIKTGIDEFHHVSTAYISGNRTGLIRETELDEGQSFCNEYEASKFAAELHSRQANFKKYIVYRPGIIVGDSRTGYTSTYHGFYAPLKSLYSLLSLAAQALPSDASVQPMLHALGLSGSENKNFIPVDWVSGAMLRIFQTREKGVYHLTPEIRTGVLQTAMVMQNSLRDFLNKKSIEKAASNSKNQNENGKDSISQSEVANFGATFASQVATYQNYWRDDPTFGLENTTAAVEEFRCPELTTDVLKRLCDYALHQNFGWPRSPMVQIDSYFDKWLESHGIFKSEDGNGVLEVRALGPGGGHAIIKISQGKLCFEDGSDSDLPRLILNNLELKQCQSVLDLVADGRAVIQARSESETDQVRAILAKWQKLDAETVANSDSVCNREATTKKPSRTSPLLSHNQS